MSTPASPSAGPLLVVVDDDASIRRALGRTLTAAGFAVKSLATGGELLASELPPDLAAALIDVHLSDVNGLDLLRQLRASHPGLPVVLITADRSSRLVAEARRQGASALLHKPLEEDRLLELLGVLLNGSSPRPGP